MITNPQIILQMEKEYYNNLYKDIKSNNQDSQDATIKIFENLDIPKITEIDKSKCDEILNESEILKAIKCMKNGRSPGTDGLTSEFYKFFWIDLKSIILDSLNYDLTKERLH